jgi:hypothetical protein
MIKSVRIFTLIAFFALCINLQAFAFTDLLPFLGEITGYNGESAEGSSLMLPAGEVDIVTRTYTDKKSTLIVSIYRSSGLKALEEHGISAGVVTRSEKVGDYTRSITESGIKKGYIFFHNENSPIKLIFEFRGISTADALKLVQELSPEKLFGSK